MFDRPERRALMLLAIAVIAVLAVGSTILSSVASAQGVPPARLGINLNTPGFWAQSRSYTNLAAYAEPNIFLPGQAPRGITPIEAGPDGWPSKLRPDATVHMALMIPLDAKAGDVIRCTWQGQADVAPQGDARMTGSGPGVMEMAFTRDGANAVRKSGGNAPWVALIFSNVTGTVTNFDCRERDRPRDQIFDPAFVKSLAPFRVVRFMEWMNVNGPRPADFAKDAGPLMASSRTHPASLRDMMVLVRLANVDPWFALPFDASDDYIRRFAQYVHDRLPPGRTVYVELGNEVWHNGFYGGIKARADGQAAGLGRYPYEAELMQYGLRTKNMADIWSRIFADRPHDLVRVFSANVSDTASLEIIAQNGVAPSIDAIAVAPYFAHDVYSRDPAKPRPKDIDDAFVQIDRGVDVTLDLVRKAKAVSDRLGKRLIAYEGGAHIVIPYDIPLANKLNRDPRMGAAYTKLLDGWARDAGDLFAVFNFVGPTTQFGGFGIREYDGQPYSEAPRAKAVDDFAKAHPRGD